MLVLFIAVVVVIGLLLFWVFFRQERRHTRQATTRNRYAVHTQSRSIQPTDHTTGQSYGQLLRSAHGDRQQVEQWIVEAQCRMPGYTRSEIIDLLATRLQAQQAAAAKG